MSKYQISVDVEGVSVEAVFNKLGGVEGAKRFLRGELVISEPVRRWRKDENGVIRFSVTSDGTTGAEWADWYKANKYNLGSEAKFMLRSSSFQPSQAGTIYEVAVLPGELFRDEERSTSKIRDEAERRGFQHGKDMNPEIVCLIRRMFSDEEIKAMGLTWIIGLHEPINGSDGYPDLFGAGRDDFGRWLRAYYDKPDNRWNRDNGFACVVPQSVSA